MNSPFRFIRIRTIDGIRKKGPTGTGWPEPRTAENPDGHTDDLDLVRGWLAAGDNIGLALKPSGVAALDIDKLDTMMVICDSLDIPLWDWLESPGAVHIRSGKENRDKLLFRVPEDFPCHTTQLAFGPVKSKEMVFELRYASTKGRTAQDVFPPSIHPDTGEPYWITGDIDAIPDLPPELLDIWTHWERWKPVFLSYDPAWEPPQAREPPKPKQPCQPGHIDPIAAFNEAHDLGGVLEANGYVRRGKGPNGATRWLRPGSSSGAAGLMAYPDGKAFSWGGDELNDGHSHDAFSVYQILQCAGDFKVAVAWSAEIETHNKKLWVEGQRQQRVAQPRMYATGQIAEDGRPEPPPLDEVGAKRAEKQQAKGGVVIMMATSIPMVPIHWIWDGWLPRGKLVLLAGKPGVGKTTLALKMGAVVTNGEEWPDGTESPQGDVLVWSGEDSDADTIRPRFHACGGDSSRLAFVKATMENGFRRVFDPSTDCDELRNTLAQIGFAPTLIIIDSIASAVSGDSNKNSDTRRGLQPLVDIAEQFNCCIVGITHFSKNSKQNTALDRVTGSVAFGGVARVVITAGRIQDNPDDPNQPLVFTRAKSNLGPDGGGFEYTIRKTQFENDNGLITATAVDFGEAVDGHSDDIMARTDNRPSKDDVEDMGDCAEWLHELLRDGGMKKSEVMLAATKRGFSGWQVRKARESLKIETPKAIFGGQTVWMLPG